MPANMKKDLMICLVAVGLMVGCAKNVPETDNFGSPSADAGAVKPYDRLPRKVIVGTVIRWLNREEKGPALRHKTVADLIDRVAAKAEADFPGRGVDLIALPEYMITTGQRGSLDRAAMDLDDPALERFFTQARKYDTYIVLPILLADDRDKGVYSNSAILIGRDGSVVGIYRKVHVAAHVMTDKLEGGTMPGSEFPVFDCDFGKLGIQICYDINYDDGWNALAAKGADVVVWPSASPATLTPTMRALRGRFFVVAATFRDNATIYEPTGLVAARVTPPEDILVHEIDLSSMVLPWSERLRNGLGFTETFGDRVGFHYEHMEDVGLFWSNDPQTTIGEMARQIGVREADEELERNRRLQDAARGGSPQP